jgi:tetratricopeptide (TPR) repeat protein
MRHRVLKLVAFAALAPGASAQDRADERLGTVHFATSCEPAVTVEFDRAVALLHSFEFGPAIAGFEGVLAEDADCAMAYWGLALGAWTNPMVPNIRPASTLARGSAAVREGARLVPGATPRERDYISAVGELFRNHESVDQSTRMAAYARAMRELADRYPDDDEAKIFYALALTASAPPTDKTYTNQLEAGRILEALLPTHLDHPGLTHYIIHTYDVPALAAQARTAALRYADIAPSAAHALHMPSHTFTRVGMWRESVETNLRSMSAAEADSALAEALHAADYAVYAYLQMRDESAARAVLARLPELASRFDPSVVRGAAPGSAGVFALAAIPARYALERGAWAEAAALGPSPSDFFYPDALTYFARALGGARGGDTQVARFAIDSLEVLGARLAGASESYWAEQVGIQRTAARAWLELAEGRSDPALALMREAAAREDATEKAAVTPGPLAPARELLGEMLLELGRPAEALVEFRTALSREPNRYRTLDGGRRAASAAGDRDAAAEFDRTLAELTRR